MQAKKMVLVRHFDGLPKATDFKMETEELPALKEDEFLCEAEFISIDPYVRQYAKNKPLPLDMIGSQIAKVIESRNSRFPKGCRVIGAFGWRSMTVLHPKEPGAGGKSPMEPELVPDLGDLSGSHALGACGMSGVTAYFGFLKICEPQEGETVVVTGAAGAVGSLVGQIAKIKGCRVIGFAGTDDKCAWLRELGYDVAINYKTCADIDAALKEAAPKGVDCYFDNVGGMLSHRIRQQMNLGGRISVCGAISNYNTAAGQETYVPMPEPVLLARRLRMAAFHVVQWWDHKDEAITQLAAWLREGKLVAQEHVTNGFENIPNAFVGMMSGQNVGKTIVSV